MIRCRVCSAWISTPLFSAEIFKNTVSYFECIECGYVQTQQPTWLEEAYASSINSSDTGVMARNLSNVSLVIATLTLVQARNARVVDYAGGHGFLVRLLRDKGIEALWSDPCTDNLVARGFEYSDQGGVALVTAFEAFEHFVDPVAEMQKVIDISPNILLTTNLIASPAPKPSDWWYYGLEHGQHIGFFRVQTLQYLATKYGLNLLTDGFSTHFFSKKKYSYAIWRGLRLVARRLPRLFAHGLKSKTWDDHQWVGERSRL